jgi:hypothetical protein
MHFLLMLLFFLFGLFCGCGYPAELDGFSPVETWENSRGIEVSSEIAGLDRAQIASNIETAFQVYRDGNRTLYKMEWWGTMHVRIWNRQVLYCDQWFIGACVHIVKGMEDSEKGEPIINLNNGGEVLLHELMHMAEPVSNPDHIGWAKRGWVGPLGLDTVYRQKVRWFHATR